MNTIDDQDQDRHERDRVLEAQFARNQAQQIEIDRLRALVRMGELVVQDFMPNIGKCVLRSYSRINDFLIAAAQERKK